MKTPRLLLRQFIEADILPFYRACDSRPECFYLLPWSPSANPEETAQRLARWISNAGRQDIFHWAIVEKDTKSLVGYINLHGIERETPMGETTYLLTPDVWGKGYMTEALTAVLGFAFDTLGLSRVTADTFAGNHASCRVLEKCGMAREGVASGRYEKDGRRYDAVLYGMEKRDNASQRERMKPL